MASSLHVSVAPETIAHVGGLEITNSLLTSFIVMIVLISLALFTGNYNPEKLKTNAKKKPGKLSLLIELLIEKFYEFLKGILGEDQVKKLFPLLFTFFFFIIIGNWIGLLPGVGSIGIWEEVHGDRLLVPLLRGPNADLNNTLALALISVGLTQYYSIKQLGFGKYISKFINIKSPIGFFVGILEIISEFAKLISFSFRLFGNIFAGEVLLVVILFLTPIFLPILPFPFLALEIFVGFIQALVFTMLTTVFIAVATQEHH